MAVEALAEDRISEDLTDRPSIITITTEDGITDIITAEADASADLSVC